MNFRPLTNNYLDRSPCSSIQLCCGIYFVSGMRFFYSSPLSAVSAFRGALYAFDDKRDCILMSLIQISL